MPLFYVAVPLPKVHAFSRNMYIYFFSLWTQTAVFSRTDSPAQTKLDLRMQNSYVQTGSEIKQESKKGILVVRTHIFFLRFALLWRTSMQGQTKKMQIITIDRNRPKTSDLLWRKKSLWTYLSTLKAIAQKT